MSVIGYGSFLLCLQLNYRGVLLNNIDNYVSTPIFKTDPNNVSDNGIAYKIPYGVDDDKFYTIVKEFIDLARIKGLTIRQAQILFNVCSEYILDCDFD